MNHLNISPAEVKSQSGSGKALLASRFQTLAPIAGSPPIPSLPFHSQPDQQKPSLSSIVEPGHAPQASAYRDI